MIPMSHFVYILQCSDDTLYVGSTNNLDKRIKQHNESKSGAHYTKIRRPVKLVYKEEVKTLGEARRREVEIKKWRRSKKFNLIENRQAKQVKVIDTEVSRPNVQKSKDGRE